jgi:hypothetical protein
MNIDISPDSTYSMYDTANKYLSTQNPIILITITAVIILYYFIFNYLGVNIGSNTNIPGSTTSTNGGFGMGVLEILLWALFAFLLVINGVQYIFDININTAIKNIFTKPEVDVTLTRDVGEGQDEEAPVPEIMIEKQVFNIPENEYTYQDAKALCEAYDARLASYDEIEDAYGKGAEWCNYGWSDDQMILYPTQKETWEKLQKKKGHKHDCGRPGINGGYIANPNARFGVNCYGYKPVINDREQLNMQNVDPYPKTKKEKELEKKVEHYRKNIKDILISPFNKNRWSEI